MSDIRHDVPTRTLAAACTAAVGGAAVIFGLFVLPAEHGIDVTGLGSVLGLTGMGAAQAEAAAESEPKAAAPASAEAAPVKETIAKTAPMRSDEMTVTLAPHTGAEIKARMAKGDHLIFRWDATGPVKADMHGEPPGKTGAFTTYWKEKDLTNGQGAFTAPFEGIHGWYWRNKGETPVTVTVKTSGFYADLFKPPAE
jgi:hypothetical protein